MKKLSFIILILCLALTSCTNDDSDTKENEAKKLEKMYQEIVTLSLVNSQPCTDPREWDFTVIGSKACGGGVGFIAYSKKINKESFLAKVQAYTDAQGAFNTKWNIFSTCDIVLPPKSVECVDGKPKLSYLTLFEN